MNTLEIAQALSKKCGSIFKGVYALDQLPSTPPPPSSSAPSAYVINTDRHDKPGMHWVACFLHTTKDIIEYFDSYGLVPLHGEILEFLNRSGCEIKYNKVLLQDLESNLCGQYCCVYLYYRHRAALDMDDFLRIFSSRSTCQNDYIVQQLFKTHFDLAIPVATTTTTSFFSLCHPSSNRTVHSSTCTDTFRQVQTCINRFGGPTCRVYIERIQTCLKQRQVHQRRGGGGAGGIV